MAIDFRIIETLNGGDFVKVGNDLERVFSFENMPYLAMFGGNKEQNTPQSRNEGEQAFDWWGNSFIEDTGAQFNSNTERALDQIPLTSSGRILIENEIKKDLEFMKPFANVTVETSIPRTDWLQINITVKRPDNLQEREFVYIWDAGRDILSDQYETNPVDTNEQGLQYELQFYL